MKNRWIATIVSGVSLILIIVSYYFWDIPLARYCRTLDRPIIDIAEIVTKLGVTRWYLIVSAASFVFFIIIYRKKLQAMRSLFVFVSLCVAGIILHVIKWLAGRNRPINLFNHDYFGFNYFGAGYELTSFPSGHAQTIFTVATALAILFPRLGIPLFIMAALVSVTRILLTAHYLSDVIAGAVVGILCTLTVKYFFYRKNIELKRT